MVVTEFTYNAPDKLAYFRSSTLLLPERPERSEGYEDEGVDGSELVTTAA